MSSRRVGWMEQAWRSHLARSSFVTGRNQNNTTIQCNIYTTNTNTNSFKYKYNSCKYKDLMEKPSGPVLIHHWSESEQYSVIQTLQIQIQIHSNTNTTHATTKCKYKYVIHADTKKIHET